MYARVQALAVTAVQCAGPHDRIAYNQQAFKWWQDIAPAKVPLLGEVVESDHNRMVWQQKWSASQVHVLCGHRVGRTSLAPGTLFLDMAREAVCQAHANGKASAVVLRRINFAAMLFLDDGEEPWVRVELAKSSGRLAILSRPHEDEAWSTIATMEAA